MSDVFNLDVERLKCASCGEAPLIKLNGHLACGSCALFAVRRAVREATESLPAPATPPIDPGLLGFVTAALDKSHEATS